MTTTATPPVELTEGMEIVNHEQWMALPAGTHLRLRRSTADWEVVDNGGQWKSLSRNGTHEAWVDGRRRVDGAFSIASLPNRVEVGVDVRLRSVEQYMQMPVGTKWITRGGATWTKITTEVAESAETGRTKDINTFSTTGASRIIEVPADLSVQGEPREGTVCPLAPETMMEYAQRFETTMWGAAIYHGVSTESHRAAMRALGCPETTDPNTWIEGMCVYANDTRALEALPDGTLVEVGDDPTNYARYGLFVVRGAGTMRVAGGGPADRVVLQVKGFPPNTVHGDGSWRQQGVTDNEAGRIYDFKRLAYEEGMRVKRLHRWCETFETTLTYADIPRNGLPARRPTEDAALTAEAVAALPVGTVLSMEARGAQRFFIRDNSMTNPARTRGLGGQSSGDWAPSGMQVAPVAGGHLSVQVRSAAELDSVPVGTVIYDTSGGARYTKQGPEAGRRPWAASRGSYFYNSGDFTLGYLTYYSFPGMTA